jgi:hypothetical protein
MKDHHFTRASLCCLLCLLTLLAGCCIQVGSCTPRAKYERTVQLSAPMSAGAAFAAQTHNGSITVNGADVADCNLTATIVGRAGTEEKAKELAEETKVTLEPSANKLALKIEKPTTGMNQSVSVSLDVTTPNQADMELVTHNGEVAIANISGRVDATTHNGKVTAEQVSGTSRLSTHNGAVVCTELSGDTQLKTHNGGVKAFYSRTARSVCNVSIVSYNGGIEFVGPPEFSAQVDASTHNGSVKIDLPVTIIGEVNKRKLTGTIGAGRGKLHLSTHNGSITIR